MKRLFLTEEHRKWRKASYFVHAAEMHPLSHSVLLLHVPDAAVPQGTAYMAGGGDPY